MDKKANRLRRGRKARATIARLGIPRLTVYRTPRHTYAQVFVDGGARVVASASTLEPDVRSQVKSAADIGAAGLVGKLVAERALAAGIDRVAFDRSGFRYHGRIRAMADAAREAGLKF